MANKIHSLSERASKELYSVIRKARREYKHGNLTRGDAMSFITKNYENWWPQFGISVDEAGEVLATVIKKTHL